MNFSSIIQGSFTNTHFHLIFFVAVTRFHLLGEFDEGKRSCRRRLADHNRRRRKQQPNAVSTGVGNSAEIASIRHGDDGDNGGVVSGKLPRVTTRYSV